MDTLELDISVPVRSFDVDVALSLGPGVFALAGPSGAGKSTILRAIAGLVRPERGRIALGPTTWFDREARTNLEPQQRSVGLVFQDYALFPHLSVAQNVAFGATGPVEEFLSRFRIDHLARERPSHLSGGERQRVALARALARRPRVLLLDEPLAALDARTRENVRAELGQVLRELAMPTVLVSHDFEDASALANQVGILVEGRIVQIGSPAELVADPRTPFVATFTGSNVLRGQAQPRNGGATEVLLEGGARIHVNAQGAGAVGVIVHPWDLTIVSGHGQGSCTNELELAVTSVVPRGDRLRIATALLTAEVAASACADVDLTPGSRITLAFGVDAPRLVPLAGHRGML